MLEIKSHWLGGAKANERATGRLTKQARELQGLSASTGMKIDDFALITFGTKMGANVNETIAVDLSTYDATTRMRFAKEFSRLFDAKRGTQGPTPSFNMSCLFGALVEPYAGGNEQPRDILARTLKKTYEGFLGATAIVEAIDGSSHEGTVTAIGGTNNFVDRREFYSQYYDEARRRLNSSGDFIVREHVITLGELSLDLDDVRSIQSD